MSNIPILTRQGRSLDEAEAIANVLAGLHTARQIAYDWAKKVKGLALDSHFTRADAHYRDFCAEHELTPQPVHDDEAHIAKRIAERDPIFIEAYPKENAAYLASLPHGGMRKQTHD